MRDRKHSHYHDLERKPQKESFRKAYGKNDRSFGIGKLLLLVVAAAVLGAAISVLT
ncbi:hypothetical protein [Alteraurantiacibacter aquimixticola]|uniref:hypothetical protein n=1 Tax=Alteraurantiacibacter aquimixticola TaxID=2489173 RepID=UPI00145B2474|nr:hypothetical protein [Alteraurantiacibacter aquimixticola]